MRAASPRPGTHTSVLLSSEEVWVWKAIWVSTVYADKIGAGSRASC